MKQKRLKWVDDYNKSQTWQLKFAAELLEKKANKIKELENENKKGKQTS
jgi:hypothetical protein